MISFFVPGIPRPAGSKRGFPIRKNGVLTGRVAVVDSNPKAKDWKCDVAHAGHEAMKDQELMTGPVMLVVCYYMPRPKAHYRKNGELRPDAPKFHISKPDALKLTRGVEDALTGIVWKDDSQICVENILKLYADDKPGAALTILPAD